MNVKPRNYSWLEFYDHIIDLTHYTVSYKAIANRFFTGQPPMAQMINTVRAVSSEGFGRLDFFRTVRNKLKKDFQFRDFFEGESSVIPEFYFNFIRRSLGLAWDWLPKSALQYDHHAYLRKTEAALPYTESA